MNTVAPSRIIAYIALTNKWQVGKKYLKKTRKTVICRRIQSKGGIYYLYE
jgi:hypothetical protein